jgi:hypothetical protein
MFRRAIKEKFIRPENAALYQLANTPDEIFAGLKCLF